MSKYYELIKSERLLNKYIEFLPKLEDDEVYFIALFARKKYYSNLYQSSVLLNRVTVKDKRDIKEKIKMMEVKYGSYKIKNKNIPQEALALYLNVNPRSVSKAVRKVGKKMWDLQNSSNFSLVSKVESIVQNSKSKTRFIGIDIDFKGKVIDFQSIIEEMKKYVDGSDIYELVTHSGVHYLIDIQEKKPTGNVVGALKKKFDIDKVGDFMSPVQGCVQGNHIPAIYNHKND